MEGRAPEGARAAVVGRGVHNASHAVLCHCVQVEVLYDQTNAFLLAVLFQVNMRNTELSEDDLMPIFLDVLKVCVAVLHAPPRVPLRFCMSALSTHRAFVTVTRPGTQSDR